MGGGETHKENMRSESSIFPEHWTPVYGCAGYEVSDMGRVRSAHKTLSPARNHDGYWRVRLGRYGHRLVHVLVLESFVEPRPAGLQACHNDGDPGNAALYNLRWDTPQRNVQDRRAHGTYQQGERNPNAKLTPDVVQAIREAAKTMRNKDLVAKFGMSSGTISQIVSRRLWSHL
jgi:hypothetical protein